MYHLKLNSKEYGKVVLYLLIKILCSNLGNKDFIVILTVSWSWYIKVIYTLSVVHFYKNYIFCKIKTVRIRFRAEHFDHMKFKL